MRRLVVAGVATLFLLAPALRAQEKMVPGNEIPAPVAAAAATTPAGQPAEVVDGKTANGGQAQVIITSPTLTIQSVTMKKLKIERLTVPVTINGVTRTVRWWWHRRHLYTGKRLTRSEMVKLLRKQGFFATKERLSALSTRVDGLDQRVGTVKKGLQAVNTRLDDHETRLEALEAKSSGPAPVPPIKPVVPSTPPTGPPSPPTSSGLKMTPTIYYRGGSDWETTGPSGEPIAQLQLVDDVNESAISLTEMTVTVTGDGNPLAGVEVLVFQDDVLKGREYTGAKGQMKLADTEGLSKYTIRLGQIPGGWRTDGTTQWEPTGDLAINLVSGAADRAQTTEAPERIERFDSALARGVQSGGKKPSFPAAIDWRLIGVMVGLLLTVGGLATMMAPRLAGRVPIWIARMVIGAGLLLVVICEILTRR